MDNSYVLMDLTLYGLQEPWEDSPAGWPQRLLAPAGNPAPESEHDRWHIGDGYVRSNGRPIAQWSRLEAGRSDDLGTGGR